MKRIGVASKEGRVLIMTTNYPDQLDEALIRPGRIDYQIAFGLATTSQIEELFSRMYMQDRVLDVSLAHGDDESKMSSVSRGTKSVDATSNEDLVRMATSFAKKVPSGRFSPAAIQGYLLKYKDDPTSALRDVDVWVAKQLTRCG